MPTQKRSGEEAQKQNRDPFFLLDFFSSGNRRFWCFCCGGVPDLIGEFSFHPLNPLPKLGSVSRQKLAEKKIGHTDDDDDEGGEDFETSAWHRSACRDPERADDA
jgi:hypothetical protein